MKNEKIIIQFHENHHWATDTQWSLTGLWINNDTDEPCNQNPCQNCIEADKAGISFEN